MLTTGRLPWAQVHRIGILASWPGPAGSSLPVGSNLMTQATTRKGAARCVRPKSCSWEAAFASSFIYLGAKAAFHRATAGAQRRADFRHALCIAERSLNFEPSRREIWSGGPNFGDFADDPRHGWAAPVEPHKSRRP